MKYSKKQNKTKNWAKIKISNLIKNNFYPMFASFTRINVTKFYLIIYYYVYYNHFLLLIARCILIYIFELYNWILIMLINLFYRYTYIGIYICIKSAKPAQKRENLDISCVEKIQDFTNITRM